MGLWDSIAGGVRNAVWSLPGGRQAFPEGNNGTIWWGRGGGLRDHAAGRTVLGASVRGATGVDAAEAGVNGIRSIFGGGSAPSRPGSVVGRGFIGGSAPRPNAIRDNRAAGVPRIDSVIPQNEHGQQVRDEVDPRIPDAAESGGASGGSRYGRSTAHVTGGDVSLSEHIRAQFNRGGTQAER